MRHLLALVRRLPVASTLVAALLLIVGSYAALAATTTTASPQTEPAPTGSVPALDSSSQTPDSLAIAEKAVAEAGQGAQPGTVRLVVPASRTTSGYALWSWVTSKGTPANMIVNPKGTPVTWTGCAPGGVAYADRCGGWTGPDGSLVLAGRASQKVSSVAVKGKEFSSSPAVLGSGGWLWVGSGFAADTPNAKVPDTVVATDPGGAVHTAPVAVN